MSDSDLNEEILKVINIQGKTNSLKLAEQLSQDHNKVVGAIKSLQCLGDVIKSEQCSSKKFELTEEGEQIVTRGSHEAIVWQNIPDDGIEQSNLIKCFDDPKVGKLGFSKAMSHGWITIDKSSGRPLVRKKVNKIDDEVQHLLERIKQLKLNDVSDQQRQELKKRKLIEEVVVKSYDVDKGSQFSLNIEKQETELTAEMIAKGTWKEKKFKEYNFDALGIPPVRGHLHPLLKVREQFRQIFLEMGFTEMQSNNYVESSFWNFDALFVPQQHPARDVQDTFFISDPQRAKDLPKSLMEKVKKVHSKGDYGSQGYIYDWKVEETEKIVLRTHTTCVSARMLYQLAEDAKKGKPFKPLKLFSIDRVFRNETLDATHLAEFQQIEGVFGGENLSIGHLMGLMTQFFAKMGIKGGLKFKPTYNPYTEPSMEIYCYHDGLKKWVEVGNSGVFRPEMLIPLGVPPNYTVFGWGLGLERPTMIKYGITNIRDLVGHKVDLQMVYDNPVCILSDQ